MNKDIYTRVFIISKVQPSELCAKAEGTLTVADGSIRLSNSKESVAKVLT